jgi:Gpi18-like mannosyltransferase
LAQAYEATRVDYAPLYLYVLYGLGKLYLAFEPDTLPGELPDGAGLTMLVKSPHIVADLLLAWLLARLVAGAGSWGPRYRDPGWGRLAALLYLFNPAVLWGSGYWGQPDAIHSLLAVASVALLARGALTGSGALLAAGGLMKPLAAPLVALVAVAAGWRRGLRGLLYCAAGGLGVAVLVFLPYLLSGRIVPVLRKVLFDIEAMPFTSVNGHNLWWLLGPWQDANAPIWGPVTPKFAGLTLFLALYAALLAASVVWMRAKPPLQPGEYSARCFALAGAVTCGFFFFSTHMHENHLFLAVPFLLAVAGRSRTLAAVAAAVSVAVFVNMALHDLALPYRLPGWMSTPAPVENRHLSLPFTWLQVVGSFINTLIIGAATWRVSLFVLRNEPLDAGE